nr:unnamed protein product [Digitaria exilis]
MCDGPPGLFSSSGLYTHKLPSTQPLSEEEIIHNIYNPVSAPFSSTIPVVEEPCPAGPSAPEQEGEEEFTLGEPEIPMRPSAMVEETPSTTGEEPTIDHAAVEPEAIVPEEPREMPETTLPEVQAAVPSSLPVPVEAQVEETIAEVLADIEQLVTQAVIEETEVERRDQNSAEPPSVMKTSQGKAKAVSEAGCSRGKQAETSTQEQAIEEIPRTFECILDVAEDEEHIDRGLYHAERAVAYFKLLGFFSGVFMPVGASPPTDFLGCQESIFVTTSFMASAFLFAPLLRLDPSPQAIAVLRGLVWMGFGFEEVAGVCAQC